MSPFMFLPPTPKMAVIRSGSSVQCVSVWVMTLLKAKTIAVVRLHSWTPPQHTHCLYVEFTHIQTHASGTSFMAVSQITAAHFQHMRNNFRQNCFEVWWFLILIIIIYRSLLYRPAGVLRTPNQRVFNWPHIWRELNIRWKTEPPPSNSQTYAQKNKQHISSFPGSWWGLDEDLKVITLVSCEGQDRGTESPSSETYWTCPHSSNPTKPSKDRWQAHKENTGGYRPPGEKERDGEREIGGFPLNFRLRG